MCWIVLVFLQIVIVLAWARKKMVQKLNTKFALDFQFLFGLIIIYSWSIHFSVRPTRGLLHCINFHLRSLGVRGILESWVFLSRRRKTVVVVGLSASMLGLKLNFIYRQDIATTAEVLVNANYNHFLCLWNVCSNGKWIFHPSYEDDSTLLFVV